VQFTFIAYPDFSGTFAGCTFLDFSPFCIIQVVDLKSWKKTHRPAGGGMLHLQW
jgi:hypothetical protein